MAKRKGLEEGVAAPAPAAIEVEDNELHKAMENYRVNADMIKSLGEENDRWKVEIEARLMAHSTKAVRHNGLIAIQCDGRTAKKLNEKKLLLAGVAAQTIADCTDPGRSYTYIQVRKEGE